MRLSTFCIALIGLISSGLIACGANAEPSASPSSPTTEANATYDLHEWGLVSVSSGSFEIAAGPGMRPEAVLTVDKPVLYVHAESALDVQVKIALGAGIAMAEHWPPMQEGSWRVHATPGPCTAARAYPSTCTSPDGYCETAELPLYETDDASCLDVGEHQLPLLFYRVRAPSAPTLPLEVRRDGENVVVRNTAWRNGVGALWRVVWDGTTGVTHATRVAVPAVGQEVRVARTTNGGVAAARGAMRTELGEHGLTAPETEAFMRAWDTALFGVATNDSTTPATPATTDEDTADMPVPPPADRRGTDGDGVDELTVDGLTDDIPAIRGGPRIADALLYWLPQDAIEGLAGIDAVPAPRHLRRAMLVRVDAR